MQPGEKLEDGVEHVTLRDAVSLRRVDVQHALCRHEVQEIRVAHGKERRPQRLHERQPVRGVVDRPQHGGERPHLVACEILFAADESVVHLAGTQTIFERRDEIRRHLANEDGHVSWPRRPGGLEARVVDRPWLHPRDVVDERGNHLGHDRALRVDPLVVGHLLGRHGERDRARALRIHFVPVRLQVDRRRIAWLRKDFLEAVVHERNHRRHGAEVGRTVSA